MKECDGTSLEVESMLLIGCQITVCTVHSKCRVLLWMWHEGDRVRVGMGGMDI